MIGNTNNGIVTAFDGKTLDDREVAYDSRYRHIIIDGRPEVGHLDVYEGNCGEDVQAVAGNVDLTLEEVFYEIEHGLDYVPRVDVYMLIRDAPAVAAALVGKYAGGYIFTGSIQFREAIFVRVSETKVQFIHQTVSVNIADPTTYNSVMQNTIIRAKIMIDSNTVAGEPYDFSVPLI